MYCWKADFRAGPPGCSDEKCIWSGWFDTLERAKEDGTKNAGVQVFSYPFLRYAQFKMTFFKKEGDVNEQLGEPLTFSFPFSSGNMLVFPKTIQNVTKGDKETFVKQKSSISNVSTQAPEFGQNSDLPMMPIRIKIKKGGRRRGRPKGSKNKPKAVVTVVS